MEDDFAEDHFENLCLQTEANIFWEAYERILASSTLEEAKDIAALAKNAVRDGRMTLEDKPCT